MKNQTVDVLIAVLTYGGNGGVATCLPSHATWIAKNYAAMKADIRIGRVRVRQFGDIPLSMERNRIVKMAKQDGFDVILMLDSDNVPDMYFGHDPNAKPFWSTSFDLLYERLTKGLPTVVCAPYCGPPPDPVRGGEENVYVFYFSNPETGSITPRLAPYTREHACLMKGIQPIGAGPTGVILYSTSAFDLMPVRQKTSRQILEDYRNGSVSLERAEELLNLESWFFYEYTDAEQTQKASTEDVTNTREIQLAGIIKHGQPVVFCNWDAWAGHYKPKLVGRPSIIPIEAISTVFRDAVRNNISAHDEVQMLDLYDPEIDGRVDQDMGEDISDQVAYLPEDQPAFSETYELLDEVVLQYKRKYCPEDDPSKLRMLEIACDDGMLASTLAKNHDDIAVFSLRNGTTPAKLIGSAVKCIVVKQEDFGAYVASLPDKEVDILLLHSLKAPRDVTCHALSLMLTKVRPGGCMIVDTSMSSAFDDLADRIDSEEEVDTFEATINAEGKAGFLCIVKP